MAPHSGVGGCTPRPIKLSPAAMVMVWATPIVACTMIGEMQLGSRWLMMMRRLLQLMDWAASIYSLSLSFII